MIINCSAVKDTEEGYAYGTLHFLFDAALPFVEVKPCYILLLLAKIETLLIEVSISFPSMLILKLAFFNRYSFEKALTLKSWK